MEKPTRSLRFRVLRGVFIVVIAANVTVALRVLPFMAPAEFTMTTSISDLAQVRKDSFSQTRMVCIVLYERYGASALHITPDAFNYLGLTTEEIRRFGRISTVETVSSESMPPIETTAIAVAETIELELAGEPVTFIFLDGSNGSTTQDIYAGLTNYGLVFYPGGN